MAKYKIGTDLYDLPEEKVESFLSKYPDAVEVTDEIQEPVTEGKTNGAVAKGATATPVTGQAPESTESEPEDILSGLEEINDTREVDRRIKIIAGDDMQIDALDSPKRIHQYNALIGVKNKIQKQAVSDIEKLPTPDRIIESFDVDKPAIKGESYLTDQGGVYVASSPLVVDGEVVGSQAQPVSLEEVEVIAPRLSSEELSEKYNSFTKNIVRDITDILALGTEILPVQTEATKAIRKSSEAAKDRREQYNRLYQEGKIDLNATRSAYNTISNSLRTMANLDDQFEYIWHLAGTQGVDEETRQKNLKKLSEARRKLNLKETYYLPTQRFDRLKEKEGVLEYALGGVAGIFDAASAVGTSFAQTPAGLFINIAAGNIKENNEINAERLGLSVDEYIESGQADFTVPIVTTALELGSEWLKLGQISKAINRMPIGRQKKIAQTMQVFGGNGAQEMFQYSLSQYNKYSAEGLSAEDATRKSIVDFFSPESFEQGLKGSFGGTAVAVGGQALKASAAIKTTSENKRIQNDINRLYELDKAKYSKNITPEQLKSINTAQAEIKKSLTQQVDANEVLVASLTNDQLETINQNYDLLTSINAEAQATKEATNLTQEQKQAILEGLEAAKKQASQEIYNVRNEGEAFVNELRKARKAVEPLSDVEILDFENTEQVKDFIQKQDKDLDTKASEEQAFVIQNPETGKQTVVINRGVAAKEAIRHEVGHVLLYQTVKDSPETAINLGNALLNELNKIDPAQVKDSNFKKRMEQYADSTRAVQMEEAVTLFSDAINTGDIKFNENVFTKLGDRVRRAMQRFGVNIKFDSGRDVYNFVKDYNKSLEKGNLSLAQVRAAAKGVEGELVTPAEQQADEQVIKESRTISPRAQEFIEEVEKNILTNENLVQIINSPSSTPSDKFAAIDAVVENNWPVISNSIKFDPTGNIPMDAVKEAVTEQMQGIFPEVILPSGAKVNRLNKPLFKDFDATRNNKVTTILGPNFLGRRQAEILERAKTINARTQGVDLTEARGIAAGETKTQEPTITRSQIDVRKFGPAKDKVNEISKIVKVKEGKAPSYKDLTNEFLDEVSMEVFNVPGKKMAGRATLTDAEAKSLQRLFVSPDNVRKLIKTMPPYNVATSETTIGPQAEIIDVSRDVKGKSIGLSNKFIEKYYQPVTTAIPGISNDKGRSLGTTSQTQVYELKPEYTGRITNEIVQQVQNDVGVTERGIPNQKISAENRSKYGTTLTGFAKTYIANTINVSARAKQTSKQEQADTGAGKPRVMLAKSGIASDMNNTVEKAGGKVLGNTIEDNQTFKTFLVDELTKFLGSETNRIIKPSDVAGAGNSAIGSRKTSGAKGRGFRFIGDINKTQRFIEETEAAIAAGEVMDLQVLRNEIKDKASLLSEDQIEDVIAATSSQTRASMARNETNKDKIKRGKRLILDALFRAVQADINNLGPIRELLYNANANSSFGRKFATVTSIESNLKPKQKTWEEHVFQFGNWANRTLQAYGTKNPDIVNGWLKWSEDNYYQEVTGRDTQSVVDGTYPGWKAKFEEHPYLKEKLDEAFKTEDFSQVPPSDIRKYNEFFTLDPNTRSRDGVTDAERYNVAVDKKFQSNPNVVAEQGKLIYQQFVGEIDAKQAENQIKKYVELADNKSKASVSNNNENNTIKFSKQVPNQEVLDNLSNADEAMANARNPEAPVKKIRVFDFDDTLARSNSNVLYEMPDGATGKLNATQFAARAGELEAQGAEFDFSEFSKVVDGKRGPVFKAIENIIAKRGAEDVFILTARPADAAGPIKEFMDALGVNLPIENIVGLGDGKAEAKARWMTAKAAEGYNDFFFVDDAYKNVKAVQDALNVFDVKSKVQQAKVKFSKKADLDKGFNDILENKTGIASEKEYGRVKAEVAGAGKGRLNFFIPPSAEDFVGLLYATLGKGKLGDQQMAWYKTHLLNPYARAMNELSSARISMMNDYKLLKKQLEIVPKNLRKKVPGEPFTREQAVRVYIWDKQGMSIPGISKKDQAELSKYVSDNAELQVFADQLIAIQKGDQYAGPKEGWPAGTITTDMLEGLNTTKRAKYLEQWQANADVIFSEKNLNKLEAAYGKPYRLAMENMLQRMKSGRNRNFQGDTLTGRFTDWVTGSIGTIMFFNTRSAILQTISSINFINFTDNNVLAAGKAFANQKQYWSDFMTLMNSDFLKERRGGLRINVSEADIADMAKKGGAKGVINKLLEFGFTPTQIADSFAIASGGSAFYRNRIKSLKKQGMTDAEAEAQAFIDFRETAEESQQSSRPDRISMQQAGPLGRLVLAFANTPAQYARLIKKAASDLKNGRGDAKTNISKIIYYGVAQNLLFNALQQALFAFAFDDDEEDTEEQQKKYVGIANGMMDSLLRGMGIGGAAVSVGKNAIIRIINEMEKKQPKLEKVGYEITKLSPPISAKLSRINQAARSYQWDKDKMKEKGWSLDNPAYLASANVIAALTNVPLDRAIKKTNNVVTATSQDLETWERLALLGGWQDWEIGIDEEKPSNKPQPRKTKPKSRNKKRKTIVR